MPTLMRFVDVCVMRVLLRIRRERLHDWNDANIIPCVQKKQTACAACFFVWHA
jgi:hypothetical protein